MLDFGDSDRIRTASVALRESGRIVDTRISGMSTWQKASRRARLRRKVVALWRRPGHITQRMVAAWLHVSPGHVGALLREAGIRIGSGRNTRRRGSRPRGAAYAQSAARLDAAMARLLQLGSVGYGDLKVMAAECGVPDSSLACRWKRHLAKLEAMALPGVALAEGVA